MKNNRLVIIGSSLILIVLSFIVFSLARPTLVLASPLATINVQSNPAGVHLVSPTTCFTVSSGTCGTTNWTSTSSSNIPITTYTYPTTATVGGITYALDTNSLTGCNSGTSGTLPNVCRVSVELGAAGTATATISAHYSVTTPLPPPTPTCYGTTNLVKNPSFETVTNYGSGTDQYMQFSQVPHWTPLDIYGYGWGPNDVLNGTSSAWPGLNAYQGTRYIVAPNSYQVPATGVVGELSSPLVLYAKYVITAQVDMKQIGSQTPHTFSDFHLRLRNSSTGAMTAIGQSASMYSSLPHWTLITQTVTPTAVYDQVVVQDDTGISAIGFIDDVHVVCKNPGTPWSKASGVLGGVAVFVIIIIICALALWHNPEFFKSLQTRNKILLASGVLVVTACIVIGSILLFNHYHWPNFFSTKTQDDSTDNSENVDRTFDDSTTIPTDKTPTNTSTTIPTDKTPTNTSTDTPTSTTTETCVDNESAIKDYSLFHSDKYKYCIQYPTDWPVNSIDATEVTFGTVPDGEPGPGWLKVTHFDSKTIATRVTEIKTNFVEPAGPCTETDATLAGKSGKKLVCIGAANGESHIFYVVASENGELIELSYIGDLAVGNTSYDSQYEVIVNSLL